GARFAIGEAVRSRATDEWVINFARPVFDHDGRLRAVLAIGTRLEHFQEALRTQGLPAGSVVRIVNEHGIVLAQSQDGPNWIGRDLSGMGHVARHLAAREVSEVSAWSDGVERITGSSTTHLAPWLVTVGLPTDIAVSGMLHRVGWGVLFVLAA